MTKQTTEKTERFSRRTTIRQRKTKSLSDLSSIQVALDAIHPELTKRILHRLDLASIKRPRRNRREEVEYLTRVAMEGDRVLGQCYREELRGFHELVLASNVFYGVDRSSVHVTQASLRPAWRHHQKNIRSELRGARREGRAKRREEVINREVSRIQKKLQLPAYAAFGPVLTGDLINAHPPGELLEQVKQKLERKAGRIAQVFLNAFITGIEQGLYGQVNDLGKPAQTFTYWTHRVTDTIASETSSLSLHDVDGPSKGKRLRTWRYEAHVQVEGTECVQHQHSTQTLVLGKLHDVESMLRHPTLDVPFNYRAVIEQTPSIVLDLVQGLFGTQVVEQHVARDIKQREFVSTVTLFVPDVWKQTWEHIDPCVFFLDRIVLFGWGALQMRPFDEFQAIVDKQRKLLDRAAAMRGKASTYFICALVVGFAATAQVWVLQKSAPLSQAVVPAIPTILCTGLFLWTAAVCAIRARIKRLWSSQATTKRLERLESKYPGFDASQPRLASEEETR